MCSVHISFLDIIGVMWLTEWVTSWMRLLPTRLSVVRDLLLTLKRSQIWSDIIWIIISKRHKLKLWYDLSWNINYYSAEHTRKANIKMIATLFKNWGHRYRDDMSMGVIVGGYDEEQGGQVGLPQTILTDVFLRFFSNHYLILDFLHCAWRQYCTNAIGFRRLWQHLYYGLFGPVPTEHE